MTITGGQALAQQLVLEGVTEVFGIPGVQLDWAVDALRQTGNRIRYLVPRHEQTTSYMADGYARTSGRIGTCMVVPGPGLLNAMAGLATAYATNSRVLAIVGNIHSSAIGKDLGLLHEVRNQSGILASVTKWQGVARTPAEVPGQVRAAVRALRSGRPQPVGVEIAPDVLSATGEVELIAPPAQEDGRLHPDAAAIAAAAALLDAARRPVIYAGGGILAADASAALAALAELIDAPVVTSEHGRGALSDRHPLALNTLAGRAVFAHADAVLVVGSRFVDMSSGRPSWPTQGQRYVYLNADAAAWEAPRRADVAVLADARGGLEALAAALARRTCWSHAEIARVRAWGEAQIEEIAPQSAWLKALRAAIPDDGILINELTQVGYLARFAYPVYAPGTLISPGYQGTLGYGFPTALGVAVANPDRAVVAITGDGGFGWGMQELATARKYDLNVVTIVFNDGHFGNVRRMQQEQFGDAFGDELYNPKFDRLAAAFEIPFARIDAPAELGRVLADAFHRGGPSLIEARVGEMPSPWHLSRLQAPPYAHGKPPPPNPLGEP